MHWKYTFNVTCINIKHFFLFPVRIMFKSKKNRSSQRSIRIRAYVYIRYMYVICALACYMGVEIRSVKFESRIFVKMVTEAAAILRLKTHQGLLHADCIVAVHNTFVHIYIYIYFVTPRPSCLFLKAFRCNGVKVMCHARTVAFARPTVYFERSKCAHHAITYT